MAFLDVKMQLNAAPAKALVQQMREGRRLAEVPLPTALAGEGLGKIRQVRRVVRGDHLGVHPFAVMAEERLLNRLANVLMVMPGSSSTRFATRPRTEVMPLALAFLVRVKVVSEAT